MTPRTNGEAARKQRDVLELIAVLLLGFATVATAWSGFQASRWNDRETSEAREATNERIESSRLFTLGAQKVAYDASIVAQYAQAVALDEPKLQEFVRTNLARPEFLPTLDKWIASVAAGDGSAENLFTNQEYLDIEFKPANDAQAIGDAANARSETASRNGSDYVLITVITATALFFAGVTTSFKGAAARLMLLAIAGITLAYAAARLVGFPIA